MFTVTFDQIYVSLLTKSIHFFKKKKKTTYWPKTFYESSLYIKHYAVYLFYFKYMHLYFRMGVTSQGIIISGSLCI